MSGNTRKNQVTKLVTLRHRSTMSGALSLDAADPHVELLKYFICGISAGKDAMESAVKESWFCR